MIPMSMVAKARPAFSEKLRFIFWGIRYFDILVLISYPTLGAVYALAGKEFSAISLFRLLVFSACNFLLAAHIFIFNDWSDGRMNPEEPRLRERHALKHPVLSDRELLLASAAPAILALLGYLFISPVVFALAAAIIASTVWYSHPRINWKGRPGLSTLIHFSGAALYFLCGYAAFRDLDARAAAMAVYFGIVLSAGHFSNEIQDYDQDLAAGIRTNAIVYGRQRMFRVGLALFLLSSAWLFAGGLWIGMRLEAALGLAAGAAWAWQAARRWNRPTEESIRGFRRFYRLLYASQAGIFLLDKLWKILTNWRPG